MNQDPQDPLDLLDPKVNQDCLAMMESKEDQEILEPTENLDCLGNLVHLVPQVFLGKRVNVGPVEPVLEWVWELVEISLLPSSKDLLGHLETRVNLEEMAGMENLVSLGHLVRGAREANQAEMATV